MDKNTNQIAIIYDNNTLKSGIKPSWGFSCLITIPQYSILFDTGGDPSILINNMLEMDINPEKINNVALSHIHGDHVGGLAGFLRLQKHNITVYLPESFTKGFKEEASLLGADIKEIEGPLMIHRGIYTTGQLGGSIKEQSLILKTSEGLVIITGCAHPGIVEIVDHVRSLFKENIYLLIGGFHLTGKSSKEIMEIAKRLEGLKVENISPCHCSGDTAREVFKNYFGKNYIECAAGAVIELPDIKE